jgi:hypothetical protein
LYAFLQLANQGLVGVHHQALDGNRHARPCVASLRPKEAAQKAALLLGCHWRLLGHWRSGLRSCGLCWHLRGHWLPDASAAQFIHADRR